MCLAGNCDSASARLETDSRSEDRRSASYSAKAYLARAYSDTAYSDMAYSDMARSDTARSDTVCSADTSSVDSQVPAHRTQDRRTGSNRDMDMGTDTDTGMRRSNTGRSSRVRRIRRNKPPGTRPTAQTQD